ncbi:unnamed protein product [Spirodela intermedia]|uniref:Uncharacterized protein n=1 Tax=Spirodela intermedia TaxID=51605 RepID=A0A7I8JQ92_SPIIN|nr:unnamed protein product [Spirodela intermedia]CAA6671602.1 unnamed protein product [Spirodela intermedia]
MFVLSSFDRGDGAPAESGHRRDDSAPAAVAAAAELTEGAAASDLQGQPTVHRGPQPRWALLHRRPQPVLRSHQRGVPARYSGVIRMPEGEEGPEAEGDAPPPPPPPPLHQAVPAPAARPGV